MRTGSWVSSGCFSFRLLGGAGIRLLFCRRRPLKVGVALRNYVVGSARPCGGGGLLAPRRNNCGTVEARILPLTLSPFRLKYLVAKGAIIRKGQTIRAPFCKYSANAAGERDSEVIRLKLLIAHFSFRSAICGCSVHLGG